MMTVRCSLYSLYATCGSNALRTTSIVRILLVSTRMLYTPTRSSPTSILTTSSGFLKEKFQKVTSHKRFLSRERFCIFEEDALFYKMAPHNLTVSKTGHNKVLIQDRSGQKYIWTMPNSSWHNFIFNNLQIEVRVTITNYGTPLITFRDVEHNKLVLQEPVQYFN